MNPEHHYIVKQAQGPLCALLKLFLGGRLKASYPTIVGVQSLRVPDKAVPHPNHPNTRFPLSAIIHQDPKAQALYETLVANSVEPAIARSILPMGVVVQMEVSGLESDWEAHRSMWQNDWCWSVTTMTEIGNVATD